ncbi:hypothetical protein HN858_03295 [Candidatus Falkowbacteria bacterium]|jgi:hypothetical protein|nr:hypothetical protein [Candidatus Falkowbacteria bacterium]MBT5503085.1 hypothetical protein [Candidatus Falkowbacteria bacterium]MBT6574179.1 hypothetical protein [Candidatus Falkowbacteria bacterium]MBT7348674.1 hypothetical protein [Candidatus Falkowbacteria bacterium]MBT7500464.1 hypothetical protein [Candidatus Falkowbacteria bacterium]
MAQVTPTKEKPVKEKKPRKRNTRLNSILLWTFLIALGLIAPIFVPTLAYEFGADPVEASRLYSYLVGGIVFIVLLFMTRNWPLIGALIAACILGGAAKTVSNYSFKMQYETVTITTQTVSHDDQDVKLEAETTFEVVIPKTTLRKKAIEQVQTEPE